MDALKEDLIWKSITVQPANRQFQILQGKNIDKFVADSISVNETYDPFGVVTWPSSEIAASILSMMDTSIRRSTAPMSDCLKDRIVLDLGCGTGLSTLTALSLGAIVIAMDNNPMTLALVRVAVDKNFGQRGLEHLDTREFNIFSDDRLPRCDYMILSDMLYSTALAKRCAERAYEAICNDAKVLITDPERSTCKFFIETIDELKGDSAFLSYDLQGNPTRIERIGFTRFHSPQDNSKHQISTKVNYLWLGKTRKVLV